MKLQKLWLSAIVVLFFSSAAKSQDCNYEERNDTLFISKIWSKMELSIERLLDDFNLMKEALGIKSGDSLKCRAGVLYENRIYNSSNRESITLKDSAGYIEIIRGSQSPGYRVRIYTSTGKKESDPVDRITDDLDKALKSLKIK